MSLGANVVKNGFLLCDILLKGSQRRAASASCVQWNSFQLYSLRHLWLPGQQTCSQGSEPLQIGGMAIPSYSESLLHSHGGFSISPEHFFFPRDDLSCGSYLSKFGLKPLWGHPTSMPDVSQMIRMPGAHRECSSYFCLPFPLPSPTPCLAGSFVHSRTSRNVFKYVLKNKILCHLSRVKVYLMKET